MLMTKKSTALCRPCARPTTLPRPSHLRVVTLSLLQTTSGYRRHASSNHQQRIQPTWACCEEREKRTSGSVATLARARGPDTELREEPGGLEAFNRMNRFCDPRTSTRVTIPYSHTSINQNVDSSPGWCSFESLQQQR
jgi:hypothetical protein